MRSRNCRNLKCYSYDNDLSSNKERNRSGRNCENPHNIVNNYLDQDFYSNESEYDYCGRENGYHEFDHEKQSYRNELNGNHDKNNRNGKHFGIECVEKKNNADKTEMLANIKLYEDSLREMEIMKDRLEVWREHLMEISSNISRDSLYIKEIGAKVLEKKIDEIMSDRKVLLNKLINRVENFSKVMSTSMECMSNSILEFERNVYGGLKKGCSDYTVNGGFGNNPSSNSKKVCRSYYQLIQRLKDTMVNINPYILNRDLNMDEFVTFNNKRPLPKEEHIFREPVIFIIDPKNMENMYLNYENINSSKLEVEGIIDKSIVINSFEANKKDCNQITIGPENKNITLKNEQKTDYLGDEGRCEDNSTGTKSVSEQNFNCKINSIPEKVFHRSNNYNKREGSLKTGYEDEQSHNVDVNNKENINKSGGRTRRREAGKSSNKKAENMKYKGSNVVNRKSNSRKKKNSETNLNSELRLETENNRDPVLRFKFESGLSSESKSESELESGSKSESTSELESESGSECGPDLESELICDLKYNIKSSDNNRIYNNRNRNKQSNENGNTILKKLIRDYSNLYAEYVVKNNISKIIGFIN
ncbi:hypothetical protein FG386_003399 [Cryptosporidium ryanae]|uniref:uncharacterized protein n=1 Tax=Cryptosporidium ryanae TaxID=515981 RepID=UPI00351A4E0A|nr:hypothetical protein FG386_003399 [Cryptosporidium ryanae]